MNDLHFKDALEYVRTSPLCEDYRKAITEIMNILQHGTKAEEKTYRVGQKILPDGHIHCRRTNILRQ